MSLIKLTDPDYRVCLVDFTTLLDLQLDAESRGWSTRWTSESALRSQVKEGSEVLLQTFLRQAWGPRGEACRCLVLFSMADQSGGGVATIDVDPSWVATQGRVDRDADVREALSMAFGLVVNGIGLLSKA